MSNNIILTGPPRSGTTLSCFLLNKLDNVVALHEPMRLQMFPNPETAVHNTIDFFSQMRSSLEKNGRAISKVKSGAIPDNPFGEIKGDKRPSLVQKEWIQFNKKLEKDFKLVIKHNGHFTFLLRELMPIYSCYAIIRNPLSVIASWNTISAPVAQGNLKVLKGLRPEIYHRLAYIPNIIDRQIQLAHYLYEAYELLPDEHIIRYEDIVATGGKSLSRIIQEAGGMNENLESRNKNKLYDDMLFEKIASKLLKREGAYWNYYQRNEVEQLLS